MALNQRQQLGSQVQRVENSMWAKYMGGPRGHKSVWAKAHTAHTVPAPMITVITHYYQLTRYVVSSGELKYNI